MAKTTENQDQKSKRDLLRERLASRYPDMNLEDEEVFYGRIGQDYDDYDQTKTRMEESRAHEQQLVDLFNTDSRSAEVFSRWAGGEHPLIAILEKYGQDFVDALNDPAMKDKFKAALDKWNEDNAKEKKGRETVAQAAKASLAAFDEVVTKGGYSPEQQQAVFEAFDRIMDDAAQGKVEASTWEMLFKAANHDSDVEAAKAEGQLEGRRAQIGNRLRKMPTDGLPDVRPQTGTTPPRPTRNIGGALARYGDNSQSIWDRGKNA